MVCRHQPGDPNCSTARVQVDRIAEQLKAAKKRIGDIDDLTPDAYNYEIVRAQEVGSYLVAIVKYPSCKKCAFDAQKILVFAGTSALDALKWKKIDPHFDDAEREDREAPSPVARFPATPDGWGDAVEYAQHKERIRG